MQEQRRIADFLDAETSKIDKVKRLRSVQLSLLAERERAVIDRYMVTETDQRVALSRLCRIQTGVTVDSSRKTDNSELRPYLRVANVKADGLDLTDVTSILVDRPQAKRAELRFGDVLMTEGGDIDKLGRGTLWSGEIDGCLHQNHVFAVRPGPRISGHYLALLTRTTLARSYFEMTGAKTTNLASTSASKILAFRVPLPSLSEQKRRAHATTQEITKISELATTLNQQIKLLTERRQALITAAVTGQLDVTTARSGVH
ncbi:type I site-specific deoxyribonuclease [Lentzea sp. NBRC 102530]|nr:type I site-specific deoxyribonuclease [Lentzea sp. NBRC 102530]